MIDSLGRRSVKAPTNDQVNLLSVLRMRKKVTQEELDRVAQTVKDNSIAIGVLADIAKDQGLPYGGYYDLCPEMSSGMASDYITRLRNNVGDFLQYDTDYASRKAIEFHHQMYGDDGRKPFKRELFEDKEDCFLQFAGLEGDQLDRFCEVVDG